MPYPSFPVYQIPTEQVKDYEIVPPVAGEQRIRVNKHTHRIEFDRETESSVDVVIKPKEIVSES
jgi:hypothetical protein